MDRLDKGDGILLRLTQLFHSVKNLTKVYHLKRPYFGDVSSIRAGIFLRTVICGEEKVIWAESQPDLGGTIPVCMATTKTPAKAARGRRVSVCIALVCRAALSQEVVSGSETWVGLKFPLWWQSLWCWQRETFFWLFDHPSPPELLFLSYWFLQGCHSL